jgi:D-glycero-alpha-D-manno-heptose 1-phosphate guanylyltransferase
MLKLLVLAGGFGTRLRSVLDNVPKALAPVGTESFLQLQLNHWHAQGVREFIFLLHHQADQIISILNTQRKIVYQDCEINWLIEQFPMDTGGAVANAVQRNNLRGDFLVTNADTWLGTGIAEINAIQAPAMAVKQLPDASRYGKVIFDTHGRITKFVEKTPGLTVGWINAGLYRLAAETFQNWAGQPFSLERGLFPKLACDGSLQALSLDKADFMDIGIPEDYRRFCSWIEGNRKTSL